MKSDRPWRWPCVVALVVGAVVAVSWTIGLAADQQESGSMSGVVVSDGRAAEPVRRAIVTVTSSALAGSRSTITDDEGRFTIDGLPAGSYMVVAARPSYVTSAYGARRPARPGVPVKVAVGEVVADLVVRLWRGAVMSGTVRDEQGMPVEGILVRALLSEPPAAAYPTLSNNGTTTDERGAFRIFGLEPGQYLLVVTPAQGSQVSRLALRDDYVDRVLASLRRAGRGISPETAEPLAADAPASVVYSPVYYPGTTRASGASPIAVNAGDVAGGLDVHLVRVPAASVTGTVTLPDGRPAGGATVWFTRQHAATPVSGSATRYGATTGPEGTFAVSHVPADTYDVSASLRWTGAAGAGERVAERQQLWAVTSLTTSGADVGGLVLRLAPGLTVNGRLRLEGPGGEGAVPVPAGATIALGSSAQTEVNPDMSLASSAGGAEIARDGTFTLTGLRPGAEVRLFVSGIPPQWWPASALLGTVDLFDGPATITASRAVHPLIVTFSDQATQLYGTLSGQQLPGRVFVVVFPLDPSSRALERRTRAVQPDADGRYQFVNLPPGDYLVGAVGDVDPEQWRDLGFLEQVAQVSVPVTLRRGERALLDLTTR